MKNIVLVGFPGAGKSTIGKLLATQLSMSFADLDIIIENKYHLSIPHFFKKYGELAFRKCEYTTLMELLKTDNHIIATGGGTPCFYDAMAQINHWAISVYLHISEEKLTQNLTHSNKRRPLLQNLDESGIRNYVQETLPLRRPYYEQACCIINEQLLYPYLPEKIIEIIEKSEYDNSIYM